MSTGRKTWREMKRAQRAIPLAGVVCGRCGAGTRQLGPQMYVSFWGP